MRVQVRVIIHDHLPNLRRELLMKDRTQLLKPANTHGRIGKKWKEL